MLKTGLISKLEQVMQGRVKFWKTSEAEILLPSGRAVLCSCPNGIFLVAASDCCLIFFLWASLGYGWPCLHCNSYLGSGRLQLDSPSSPWLSNPVPSLSLLLYITCSTPLTVLVVFPRLLQAVMLPCCVKYTELHSSSEPDTCYLSLGPWAGTGLFCSECCEQTRLTN